MTNHHFIKIFQFLCLFIFGDLLAQPTAIFISEATPVCDQALVSAKVQFTGTSPFGIKYKITHNKPSVSEQINSSEVIHLESDLIYTIANITIGRNEDDDVTIQLLQIRDRDMPEGEWIDVEGQSLLIFPTYKQPEPQITLSSDKCGYTSTITAANNNLKSPSYLWEVVGDGQLSSTSGIATLFTSSQPGTFQVKFTEKNGVCQAEETVSVELMGTPKGNISGSTIICTDPANTDAKRLDVALSFQGTATFQVELSNGTKFSTNSSTHNLVIEPTAAGSVLIASITDGNGCKARVEDRTGVAVITDRRPKAYAGSDIHVCDNEGTLEASLSSSLNSGYWRFVNNADGEFISSANSAKVDIRTFRNGSVPMRWTEVNTQGSECTDSDEAVAKFDLPIESVYAGKDTVIYVQNSYKMSASIEPWQKGEWSVEAGGASVDSIDNPASWVRGLTEGMHSFRWTVTNGDCPSLYADVDVELKNMRWPNAFSPNGDGVNDFLEILGARSIDNNELIVYDMKGSVVYRKANYDNTWGGTNMGNQPLADGYYYYIFTGDGIKPIKESLIIKRSKQ